MIAVAFVALAVGRLDLHALGTRLVDIAPGSAIAALSLLFAGQVVSAIRWRTIAAGQALHAPAGWFVAAYLRGCFYNALLPTGIGGDAVRVRLCRRLGPMAAATRSVVFDRVSGLAALLVTAAALVPLTPQLVPDTRLRSAAVALDVVVVVALVAGALARRLPAWIGWSVLFEVIWFAGVWVLARALGVEIPPPAVPAVVLVVGVASALPVSIGAAGTREAAFVLALAPLGVPATAAVALGIAFGAALTLVGLTGAVVRLPPQASPLRAPAVLGVGAR